MSLLIEIEKAFKDEDIDITREDYIAGYALFCSHLSPDLGESNHFSLYAEFQQHAESGQEPQRTLGFNCLDYRYY